MHDPSSPSGQSAPLFHVVDIQGDLGSHDYDVSSPLIFKCLAQMKAYHELQSTLADVVEATVTALTSATAQLNQNNIAPQHRPLISLVEQIFVKEELKPRRFIHSTDGAVLPEGAYHVKLFEALECLTYRNFFNSYETVSPLLMKGELYTACDSRWKVLRSRFRLHRAFNADMEDHHNIVLGGGDAAYAAKVDIRRIGTCVSAKTLTAFMNTKIAEVHKQQHKPEGEDATLTSNPTESAVQTVELAVENYFGVNRPEGEKLLTAEGLSLKPNYTQVTEKRLDVFERNDPMRPRGDHSLSLLRHFLKFQYGEDGKLLADLIVPNLTSTLCMNKEREYVELELTVHGLREGEIEFLADWFQRFDLYRHEPNIRVSLRVVLMHIDHHKYPTTKSFDDVLKHLFVPLWNGLLDPLQFPKIAKFLSILNGISAAIDDASEGQSLPLPGTAFPSRYGNSGGGGVKELLLPPDAYFFFHVWRNTQLFNFGILAHLRHMQQNSALYPNPAACMLVDRTLQFRIHSDNKLRSFAHCTTALLIADTIVNPMRITQWAPLGYMFYLTQRHVVLTPSVNNGMNVPFNSRKSALAALIEVGVNVSVATMDPLHYHSTDNALQEELHTIQKVYHLSASDLTELCLRSIENANLSVKEIKTVFPNCMRSESLEGVESAGAYGAVDGALVALSQAVLPTSFNTTKLQHVFSYHDHRKHHSVTALYNKFPETQVPTPRLAFRELCHEHEISLLTRVLLKKMVASQLHLHGSSNLTAFWSDVSAKVNAPPPSAGNYLQTAAPLENHIKFPRLIVRGPHLPRPSSVAKRLVEALHRRSQVYRVFNIAAPDKVPFADISPQPTPAAMILGDTYAFHNGVIMGTDANGAQSLPNLPTWSTFFEDFRVMRSLAHDPEAQSFCRRRLATLEHKFELHRALMDTAEYYKHQQHQQQVTTAPRGGEGSTRRDDSNAVGVVEEAKQAATTSALAVNTAAREFSDLYRCVKVDVHCHMASGVTGKQLLDFMQTKAEQSPDDIVGMDTVTRKPITLRQLLERVTRSRFGPTATINDLTVSSLDVQASSSSTFNRFDQFNNKYNPLGMSELRTLFLKTDNFMGGRYFAELIHQTFARQEAVRSQTFSEFRLSIYGRRQDEWKQLAQWFAAHGMNRRVNRWMIQVPRIYAVYKKEGSVSNFGEMLSHIFLPLWEVTINPNSNPILAHFLENISGFDSVDNESAAEREARSDLVPPHLWTSAENPPFSYWMYFMWANIASLNHARKQRGLSTFAFRPHCGESGDPDHLIDGFLLADGINHGIQLKRRSVLQYLFYLTQTGLGMTPLSNNALFCRYHDNPFPSFFMRGLNVALATDGPLQFHHTDEPLTEEYATAMKFWDLSTVDACEIAANSVRMSGFPTNVKKQWLGELFVLRSTAGNDAQRSRVPHSRVAFRYEVYENECKYLESRASNAVGERAMMPPYMEELLTIDTVGLSRPQVLERRLLSLPVERVEKVEQHLTCKL